MKIVATEISSAININDNMIFGRSENTGMNLDTVSSLEISKFQKEISELTLEKSLHVSTVVKCAHSIEQLLKGQ